VWQWAARRCIALQHMNAEEILGYNVCNNRGQLVPFSAFASIEWSKGPTQIAGFNYYPAIRISGEAKPGYMSGDAIAEMERLAGKLPAGFGYEWARSIAAGKAFGLAGAVPAWTFGAGGVPVPGRAL
jgi:multidrug efflux pump subunit AcrB